MKIADLHTHTTLCNHATGKPEEFLRAALAKGESWYGISDHCPWTDGFDPGFRMKTAEFPHYRELVSQIRKMAQGTPLKVLYAMELDYIPGKHDEIQREFANEDFDYLIGSIHQTEFFPFDNPEVLSEWKKDGVPEHIWDVYVRYLKDYVSTWDFQIIGHCDIPKKFGYKPSMSQDFLRKMQEIFEIAASRGIALEINAAGLHTPVKELYPSPEILKLARKAGMNLTYGSDAHAPEQIGRNFDKAVALAKECGFDSFVTFEKKQIIRLPF